LCEPTELVVLADERLEFLEPLDDLVLELGYLAWFGHFTQTAAARATGDA